MTSGMGQTLPPLNTTSGSITMLPVIPVPATCNQNTGQQLQISVGTGGWNYPNGMICSAAEMTRGKLNIIRGHSPLDMLALQILFRNRRWRRK